MAEWRTNNPEAYAERQRIDREAKRARAADPELRAIDKVRLRRQNLKRKYGITLEEYEALFDAQGGVCAICGGQSDPGFSLAVDHHHGTGNVRALLCSYCNRGIGLFRERSDWLRRAADYLTEHSEAGYDQGAA